MWLYMKKENLQIKDLVKITGLDRETLRFYEKKGLLPKPTRTSSGYRVFSSDIIDRLEFIKIAKEAGFSLKEIIDILNLGKRTVLTKRELNSVAQDKIETIDEKIESLKKMRQLLVNFTRCAGAKPTRPMTLILNEFKNLRDII